MTDQNNYTTEGSFLLLLSTGAKIPHWSETSTNPHPLDIQLNSVLFRERSWSQPLPVSVACLEVSLQSFGLGSKEGSVSGQFEGLTEAFELFSSCVSPPA